MYMQNSQRNTKQKAKSPMTKQRKQQTQSEMLSGPLVLCPRCPGSPVVSSGEADVRRGRTVSPTGLTRRALTRHLDDYHCCA